MRDPIRRLELGRFLRDRRARVKPAAIGLTTTTRRRVAGLRREEVATLAGVGATWYAMLEKGTAEGVSAVTLEAIAHALRLTPDETAYLHSLADATTPDRPSNIVDPLTRAALGAIEWMPAYICTTQWLVLAWNDAMARVWGIEPPGGAPFNIVRRSFRDERIRALHGERFPSFARALVAMVRSGAGSRGDDPITR